MANRKAIGHHQHGPMRSKAQWRFLMATQKEHPFARRWAEEIEASRGKKVGYHSLPERRGIRKRV